MTTKDLSLKLALEEARCPELPRQLSKDETRFWVEAIVLVQKRNSQQSYCIAKRRGDGSFSYTKDFGSMSPISGQLAIYPYLYLDDKFLFPKKSIPQKRYILRGAYPDKADIIDNATEDEIQTMILEYGIQCQQESVKSSDILDEIAERIENASEDDNFFSTEDIPVANRSRKTANKVK